MRSRRKSIKRSKSPKKFRGSPRARMRMGRKPVRSPFHKAASEQISEYLIPELADIVADYGEQHVTIPVVIQEGVDSGGEDWEVDIEEVKGTASGFIRDDKKVGKWVSVYPDGKIWKEEFFDENGKLHSYTNNPAETEVSYGPDGSTSSVRFKWYDHGKLHRVGGPAKVIKDSEGNETHTFYLHGKYLGMITYNGDGVKTGEYNAH